MTPFYTILTNYGKTTLAEALAAQQPLEIPHMAAGDGGGSYYDPVEEQTNLRNELWRGDLNDLRTDANVQGQVIAEAIIPMGIDGDWTVREIGLFDVKGGLIAIGKYPENYIPPASSGAKSQVHISIIINVDNVAAVQLVVDHGQVLASKLFVANELLNMKSDFGQIIKTYPSVFEMKSDPALVVGVTVSTLGFHHASDGGSARYRVVDNKDVNGFTVIQGNGVVLELLDINMKSMGVFDGDDAKPCIQFCVDNNIKIHDSGSYKLSSSVVLPDHYFEITGKPLFDGGSATTRLFYHARKEEKEVSLLTNYLNTGNYICQLSTDEIPVGAIVRFVSNRHITEFWTSEVIRDYYNWGEINKVIAKNGNMYTFEVPFYFNYRPSEMKSVSWYLPREGCKLDIRVRCDKSEVFNGNTGVEIWQCDDNVTIDIESEGFNSNGLLVGQCWKPTIPTVFSIGGNDLSERNYGINIADGTRGFSVGLVQGINNRHAFTGGGSGRAIPMEGSVDTIIHTNPSKTSAGLHGPDTHANAASFTIGKCISDTTCSFSGIGHIINSAECNGGYMTFANEGGFNISYGTVHVKNPERLYPGISVMKSSYIGRLSIQLTKFIPEQQLSINKDNGSLEIESLFFENQAIAGVTSNEAASEIATAPFIIRGNVAINTASFTGVPMLMLVGDGCSIQKLKLTDCGWGDVNTVHFYGNKNVSINSIVTNHSNGSLTYPVTSRLIGFNQSSGVTHSGVSISNLSGYSKKGRVIDVGKNVSSSMFTSNNIYGVSYFDPASQSMVSNWRGTQ